MFRFVDDIDNRFPDKVFKKAEIVKMKEDSKKTAIVGQDGVASITSKSYITAAEMNASVVNMDANERNFPDEDVQSVIDSLEQQFGCKDQHANDHDPGEGGRLHIGVCNLREFIGLEPCPDTDGKENDGADQVGKGHRFHFVFVQKGFLLSISSHKKGQA